MNNEELIKLFIKSGYQLSANALPLVSVDPKEIIKKLNKLRPRPFIVTEEHVKKILQSREVEVKVLKKYQIEKKPIKIENYINYFISRYEKMKNLVLENTKLEKLISINKITEKTSDFSIIGIVREKTNNSLIVEDPTGEVELFLNNLVKHNIHEIGLDDIIGLTCKRVSGKYHIIKIFYPDIPLNREIGKTKEEKKIIILPLITDEDKKNRLQPIIKSVDNLAAIFSFNHLIENNINVINIEKNQPPTLFELDKVKILVLQKDFFNNTTTPDVLISLLKKRHLKPKFDIKKHIDQDVYVLEEVPDIIISNLESDFYKNYKGTTIISSLDKMFIIDLKTRDVIEKNI